MSSPDYSSETLERIKKLERIRALWVNPFATRFDMTSSIGQIISSFHKELSRSDWGFLHPENNLSSHLLAIDPLSQEGMRTIEEIIPNPRSDVALAGRVMLHRSFGKICFATISDGTGRIQVLFSRENCTINTGSEVKTELPSIEQLPDTRLSYDGPRVWKSFTTVSAYKFAEKLIDTTVKGIIDKLDLRRPIYQATSAYGHFGKKDLPWEQIAK